MISSPWLFFVFTSGWKSIQIFVKGHSKPFILGSVFDGLPMYSIFHFYFLEHVPYMQVDIPVTWMIWAMTQALHELHWWVLEYPPADNLAMGHGLSDWCRPPVWRHCCCQTILKVPLNNLCQSEKHRMFFVSMMNYWLLYLYCVLIFYIYIVSLDFIYIYIYI